jgi:hypothetical protein
MKYALITKHRTPEIIILADTIKELDDAINTFYWNIKGMQAQGSKFELSDLMKDYFKVKITIKKL